MRRPPILLGLCLLISTLVACSREIPGVRVDFALDAKGHCSVELQPQPCDQAGSAALSRHPDTPIHAVLVIDDAAPVAAKEALVTGIKKANISHMQFGVIQEDKSQTGHLVF
jgi:hypothetical protein